MSAQDLLLPFREQATPIRPGQRVIASIYLAQQTHRIVATPRLHRHLNRQQITCREG
jgi:hypothetical protein